MYGDTSRIGIPFSKDPHVVEFQGKYLMYYSIPPKQNGNAEAQGWGIGIAGSKNLKDWHRIGEIIPQTAYESKGLCAPGALVRNDTVHLFYQTYGKMCIRDRFTSLKFSLQPCRYSTPTCRLWLIFQNTLATRY